MTSSPLTVGVVGAGAWGTALAIHLASLHDNIGLWGRNQSDLALIEQTHKNARYLPKADVPKNIQIHQDLPTLIHRSEYILIVTPSVAIREIFQQINTHANDQLQGVMWATKGLDYTTGKFLHDVAKEDLPGHIKTASISGPSFANEVAQGLPTAVTVASNDGVFAEKIATLFHSAFFRTYTSTDVIGIEIGGTFKNILAIAAGILDGLEFGSNARAALITRGIAEMSRFGKAFAVQPETLMGLSGVGDIVLSCMDDQSRNRRLGLGLGAGKSLSTIEDEIGQVLEGKFATKVVHEIATKMDIELPISQQVYEVIYNNKVPKTAVEELLARTQRKESD